MDYIALIESFHLLFYVGLRFILSQLGKIAHTDSDLIKNLGLALLPAAGVRPYN